MGRRKKIHIVWLVNDKVVNNFVTVYWECKKSSNFTITVIAVPRLGYPFSPFLSSKEVFDYLMTEGIECINSFDEEKQTYLDIESLSPDYVFTTTPYDIYLPEKYRSDTIKSYAKLCNIYYGPDVASRKINNTAKNVYLYFTVSKKTPSNGNNCIDIGCMKLDEYLHYGRKKERNDEKFQVAWKPRWTLNKDESHLIEYIEQFYQWTVGHPNFELLFIEHPMLEENAKKFGWNDYYKYKDLFNMADNISVTGEPNFMDDVMAADVFIGDYSSTLIEFAITGRPILFTKGKKVKNSPLLKEVMENSYIVRNFEEIVAVLSDLKSGKDILKQKRNDAAKSYFTIPPRKMSSAEYLLEILKADYKKHPYIKKHRISIGDAIMVNGFGSESAWSEKDKNLRIINTQMMVLYIREDGIHKFGCGNIGSTEVSVWLDNDDVIHTGKREEDR